MISILKIIIFLKKIENFSKIIPFFKFRQLRRQNFGIFLIFSPQSNVWKLDIWFLKYFIYYYFKLHAYFMGMKMWFFQ